MAQRVRQTKLFAAEDYSVVYDAYVNANFKAFDFDTIRDSIVEYVRSTYPESFNDWIESNEFVALLDIVAQFGHNLAFRSDLNARDNFLSTSQRQSSVYKLANFLGYKPKRSTPASGSLKIVSVKTNEDVIGSDGNTLSGKDIRFESTNNVNNIEDFVAVMNAIFTANNQFGNPRKSIRGTDIYSMNTVSGQTVFEFSGVVQGTSESFNAYSVDINNVGKLTEVSPNTNSTFNVFYKNDGKGISSNGTGFFLGFKQGSIAFQDFQIDNPIGSLSLDINQDNINNDDVWVQSIDENGNVIKDWKKVENAHGLNEIYNNISNNERDIFSVNTREDGQISIMFPSEEFGNLPKNIIRVWYRTSVNQSYSLRPDDIGSRTIRVPYIGIDGNVYAAQFVVSLRTSVNNASARETLDDIRENAPRVYSAQDRMITASDYNNYLISKSDQIAKIKSVNRTHAGHSRWIDLADPTGEYSNVKLYNTDGILSREDTRKDVFFESKLARVNYENVVLGLLSDPMFLSYYFSTIRRYDEMASAEYTWNNASDNTGWLTDSNNNIIGSSTVVLETMVSGSLLQFQDPINPDTHYWAMANNIFNYGLGITDSFVGGLPTGVRRNGQGAIALDRPIPSGSKIISIIPPMVRKFSIDVREQIVSDIENDIDRTYYYDPSIQVWSRTDTGSGIYIEVNKTKVNYPISKVTFESDMDFSNTSNEYVLGEYTNKSKRDTIEILDETLRVIRKFFIIGYDFDESGVFNKKKVYLGMTDGNNDMRPDDPESLRSYITQGSVPLTDQRFQWSHFPAVNEIVDPSFTNIIDAFILTKSYDIEFRNWLKVNLGDTVYPPVAPTFDELNSQFSDITDKKAMSDTVIYRPVKYKILFGNMADSDVRAGFQIIKLPNTQLTDSEIKSKVIDAIEEFFHYSNWEFGETFYFTELAAYVHKKLVGVIGSFVIVPESTNSVFGKLFQITPESDELFIPDVGFDDIEIALNITKENIRMSGNA